MLTYTYTYMWVAGGIWLHNSNLPVNLKVVGCSKTSGIGSRGAWGVGVPLGLENTPAHAHSYTKARKVMCPCACAV